MITNGQAHASRLRGLMSNTCQAVILFVHDMTMRYHPDRSLLEREKAAMTVVRSSARTTWLTLDAVLVH